MQKQILQALGVVLIGLALLLGASASASGGVTTQITDDSDDDWVPGISGSNVVWEGNDGNDYEIYLKNTTLTSAFTLGVMGDSLSDEYGEESYGSYAQNWVEQLAVYGVADVGPTASEAGEPGGSWGEPHRTGYQYNL